MAGILVWLSACVLGCASEEPSPLPPAEDPAGSFVVFGSLCSDGLLFNGAVSDIVLQRIEPGGPELLVEPYRRGSMFFTDPLPVGGGWKISSFTTEGGTLVTVRTEAPGGASPLVFYAESPGLLFLGSFSTADREILLPSDVTRRDVPTELDLLRDLLDAYRGTPWEKVILSRIHSRH
ncbi:MAG TPA: hypothetical protein VMV03_04295 [Spirochaetia bacterium]|nr:hypothetical protein [Spirochaetia bacterium]